LAITSYCEFTPRTANLVLFHFWCSNLLTMFPMFNKNNCFVCFIIPLPHCIYFGGKKLFSSLYSWKWNPNLEFMSSSKATIGFESISQKKNWSQEQFWTTQKKEKKLINFSCEENDVWIFELSSMVLITNAKRKTQTNKGPNYKLGKWCILRVHIL
jgi:hypothetical protein